MKKNILTILLSVLVLALGIIIVINEAKYKNRLTTVKNLFLAISQPTSKDNFILALKNAGLELRKNQPISLGYNSSKAIRSTAGDKAATEEITRCETLTEIAFGHAMRGDRDRAYAIANQWLDECANDDVYGNISGENN